MKFSLFSIASAVLIQISVLANLAYGDERIWSQLPEQSKDASSNALFWAHQFLGLPYGYDGPLGEGPEGLFDQDPLYRFDLFDCTTFVETALSLALARTKEEFERFMLSIRYDQGEVSYVTRNHITSLAWIPRNERNGFFQDASASFSPALLEQARGVIDYPGWLRSHTVDRLNLPMASLREKEARLNLLERLADRFFPEEVELDYLDIDKVLANWDQFKAEAAQEVYILNVVRPNWNLRHLIGTNLHISHQGFAFMENGTLKFLHASSKGKVVKEDLRGYLESASQVKSIRGINLLSLPRTSL